MAIPVETNINTVDPNDFTPEGFQAGLGSVIPATTFTGSFYQGVDVVQYYVYDVNKDVLYSNNNYTNYIVTSEPSPQSGSLQDNLPPEASSPAVYKLELQPEKDLFDLGYSAGTFFGLYNFIKFELESTDQYFISEISPSRTEIRIANNFLDNETIINSYNEFNDRLKSGDYFDEFYIDFGLNRTYIATNCDLEIDEEGKPSILIKLYTPLPSGFGNLSLLSIITKVAESLVYKVEFIEDLSFVDSREFIKGPNYDVFIKDSSNDPTNYKSLEELISPISKIDTASSSSQNLYLNLNNQRGVYLRTDYNKWDNFIHYSSAEKRLENFKRKVEDIESFQAEISQSHIITGDTTSSLAWSSSLVTKQNKINDIVRNFDGYEYFLYFMTGSTSWPKSTSTTYPFKLYSATSSQVLNWYGSTNDTSPYFGTGKNLIYSASLYDENNKDNLFYIVPSFISNNQSNEPYIKFVHMAGQLFDDIWLYTKAFGDVRNSNTQLTGSTLPMDLADEAIESFGFKTYPNDFNSQDFSAKFVDGVTYNNNLVDQHFPGSQAEGIRHYIDVASGSVINYYDNEGTTLGYIVQLIDHANLYPQQNSAQEIYKRIFHNMVSLVKRKGTVEGLKQLINIWGVPNTMLRVSEFGGKTANPNDFELFQEVYNKEFTTYQLMTGSLYGGHGTAVTSANLKKSANAIPLFPWQHLTRNYRADKEYATPDSIQFRFKTARPIDIDTNFSESLLLKYNNVSNNVSNGQMGIYLEYSGSNSGSHSGSILSPYHTYASMSFVFSGSVAEGAESPGYFKSDPIYLPFYNKKWWSVQFQRLTHTASNHNNFLNTYELRVAQKGDDGADNFIKYEGLVTMSMGSNVTQSLNYTWNFVSSASNGPIFATSAVDSIVKLGGNASAIGTTRNNGIGNPTSNTAELSLGDAFSGSFQEFRYYARALSQSVFNKFVMNPHFIGGFEGKISGAFSGYDILNYRVPLGSLLEHTNPVGKSYLNLGTNYSYLIFGGRPDAGATSQAASFSSLGSVHPAASHPEDRIVTTGKLRFGHNSSDYTSSFINKSDNRDVSNVYQIQYTNTTLPTASADFPNPSASLTSSHFTSNNETYYYDQPAMGLRNRITNKIHIPSTTDAFGNTLSPFRSIIQDYPQSQSYNENINNLEVGFSFENEINDDIISSYEDDVISSAISDPLEYFKSPNSMLADYNFWDKSEDRYDKLVGIARDYFKKFRGLKSGSISAGKGANGWTLSPNLSDNAPIRRPGNYMNKFDYNRLIKFYESSLFKAIKNYVPARTSISTGIIVKPHLLERNKIKLKSITTNYPQAKTSETGSRNGTPYYPPNRSQRGYGYNSVIENKNLEITATLPSTSISGGAGGSVNKYNYFGTGSFESGVNKFYFDNSDYFNSFNKVDTQGGLQYLSQSNVHREFYDGEYSGSTIEYRPKNYINGSRYNPYRIDFETIQEFPLNQYVDFTSEFVDNNLYPSTDAAGRFQDSFTASAFNEIRIKKTSQSMDPVVDGTSYAFFNFGFRYPGVMEDNMKYEIKYQVTNNHSTGANKKGIVFLSPYYLATGTGDFDRIRTSSNYISSMSFTYRGVFGDQRDAVATIFISNKNYTGSGTQLTGTEDGFDVNLKILSFKPMAYSGSSAGIHDATKYIYTGSVLRHQVKHLRPYDGFKERTISSPIEQYVPTIGGNPISIPNIPSAGNDNASSSKGFGNNIPNYPNIYKFSKTIPYFINSEYNVLINNVSESRKNTHHMDVDYSTNQYVPVNTQTIADQTAKKAQVPDSYYTDTEIITGRYKGTKLTARRYNVFDEKFFDETIFLNRDTGSFTGDISYGVSPVITTNPLYIAHFKNSKQSREFFGTVTFTIDELIVIPNANLRAGGDIVTEDGELIEGDGEYNPIIINVEGKEQGDIGSSGYLTDIASTFDSKFGEVRVNFDSLTKNFSFSGTGAAQDNYIINYSAVQPGLKGIMASAGHYISKYTTERDVGSRILTHSIATPLWYGGVTTTNFK